MSSHREAPEISKDPVADSTDLYAFVSPDNPDTVTLIANYIPLQEPAGGPNFYEFGDDVRYEIHVDNNGDGKADITYRFEFETKLTTPASFLYNTGPIGSLSDPNWNSKQFYKVTRVDHAGSRELAGKLGIELLVSIDQRIAGAEKVGEHKTSMLQDLEARRPLELDEVVGAVVELGERELVDTPVMRAIYACAKLLDQRNRAG